MTSLHSLLPLIAQAAPETEAAGGMHAFLVALVVIAVIVVPFLLGNFLARSMRLPDYGWKIGLVLLAAVGGTLVTTLGWPPKLGIDLAGGVILVYQLAEDAEVEDQNSEFEDEAEEGPSSARSVDMDKMVAAIRRRVDPAGIKELTIRPYGPRQIEVIIPQVDNDEVDLIKRKISTAGLLEFRVTANETDHQAIIDQALKQPNLQALPNPSDESRTLARWVKLAPEMRSSEGLVTRESGGETQVLVVTGKIDVNGGYLRRASPGIDEMGRTSVNFSLNSEGGRLFGILTRQNLPDQATGFQRRIGIVLDDVLLSAPFIQSAITDNGQITNVAPEDVEFLVGILNAGSLPAALEPEPISEQKISPTLGQDTIAQGERSMVIGSALVLLFMLVYYRFAGIVACLVLTLNLVLVIALMITVKAALTLPGMAGLVLTVGMAVDANVLIYERIREELNRGATLKMAIRNGFDRATSTIVDANLTTLIVGIVLYAIGTDQIKGFAVTLILGIVLSMFTAIFCARVVFEVAERRRWISELHMMRLLTRTNFNFVKYYRPAVAVSVIGILIGLSAVVSRGYGILDIDFTGGSSVHILFKQQQETAYVRSEVGDRLPDATVVSVGEENLEFKIDTSLDDRDAVQQELQAIFGEKLQTNTVEIGDYSTIAQLSLPVNDGLARADLPAANILALANFQADADEPGSDATNEAEASQGSPQAELNPDSSNGGSESASGQGSTDASPESSGNTNGSETETAAVDPFSGGTQVVLNFPESIKHDTLVARIRDAFRAVGLPEVRFEVSNEEYTADSGRALGSWTLRMAQDEDKTRRIVRALEEELSRFPVFPSSSKIGGKVAGDTQQQALAALGVSLVGIIMYIWLRFQNLAWGVASVIALVHDVLTILGALALSAYLAPVLGFLYVDPFKIGLTVIAAFLTVIGYSINDTIVIFDRMREVKGKSKQITEEMVNKSLNQTLSRSIITSLTVFIVVVALYFLGGQAIRAFAFALLIGVITGSYSSVFIAAPLVLWLTKEKAQPPARNTKKAEKVPVGASG